MSWLLPSKRSDRLSFPFGPSNTYSFSTFSQGSARRCVARASRLRVNAFSLVRNAFLTLIHFSCETTGWLSLFFDVFFAFAFMDSLLPPIHSTHWLNIEGRRAACQPPRRVPIDGGDDILPIG